MKPSVALAQMLTEEALSDLPPKVGNQTRARQKWLAVWVMKALCPHLSKPALAEAFGYADRRSVQVAIDFATRCREQLPSVRDLTDQMIRNARHLGAATLIDAVNRKTLPAHTPDLSALVAQLERQLTAAQSTFTQIRNLLSTGGNGDVYE
ncbi:hypothetical protein [Asticcacaulis sp. YBE204]|uniref:hypothetical protein n=1 Tax=Asticcacaulis sp. YBE204 TaxID=1282363 RepID=UPI0003C40C5D|nr:hypothetical protein [Asticcacaulis sp. YBE204]ESQ78486.1 hypothetical protein AEYBE204_13105 [Asticcacaulis sp. YBE204]